MKSHVTPTKLKIGGALLAGIALATSGLGADDGLPSREEMWKLIQSQQSQIQVLNDRLGITEAKVEQTAEQIVATDEKIEATSSFVEEMAQAPSSSASSSGSSWADRTQIGGYGELHLNLGDNEMIDFHRWVLFFGQDFSDSIRMFSELELEHSLAGDGKPGEVELEQAYIEMDLDDTSKLKAGLFLLPIGFLNETHEPNTFYGVERNNIEKEIIPTTWWEAGLAYTKEFDNGFSTDVAIHSGLNTPTTGSNAFRIRSGRQKVAEALASDFAGTVRVNWSGTPGVKLSAALQHQQDVSQGALGSNASALLYALTADIERGAFGLRALYAGWDIDGAEAAALGRDKQDGFYLEPSYKIDHEYGSTGFFVRYGMYDQNAGNSAETETDVYSFGVNYWPHQNVVFKVDFTKEEKAGSDNETYNFGAGYQF